MQAITTLSFHFIPIIMAAIKTNNGKEVEWGNPYTLLLRIGAATMRPYGSSLENQIESIYTNLDYDYPKQSIKGCTVQSYLYTCVYHGTIHNQVIESV